MLLTAELLLYYQRCNRRAFLDVFGDRTQRDPPSDYLLKLMQDGMMHRQTVLAEKTWQQPDYPPQDWDAGTAATVALMRQGVDCIHRGVLLQALTPEVTLLSRPDLLIKHPGQSIFGDWLYIPMDVKLGKRPKLEYQIVTAFDVQVLASVQEGWPETAWLLLREKGLYAVDLWKVLPEMQTTLDNCIQMLQSGELPEVFIARSRCGLCHWYNYCYDVAQSEQHLSLLPGVTVSRYAQLKAADILTVEAIATSNPDDLEDLPGFGRDTAHRLVLQAQAVLENRAIARPDEPPLLPHELPTAPVELYFDIEAEPELNVAYLQGVLVVDRRNGSEEFHPFLAEQPEDEAQTWNQFLELVWRYPDAPIFHFCPYEVQTTERLAQLYGTPDRLVKPLMSRFVDLHERVTRTVILPVESYALKPIARWVGFDWRDPNANGAQAICWYAQWLETGDRSHLDATIAYNEDDCRAMRYVKDWLCGFMNLPQGIAPTRKRRSQPTPAKP